MAGISALHGMVGISAAHLEWDFSPAGISPATITAHVPHTYIVQMNNTGDDNSPLHLYMEVTKCFIYGERYLGCSYFTFEVLFAASLEQECRQISRCLKRLFGI